MLNLVFSVKNGHFLSVIVLKYFVGCPLFNSVVGWDDRRRAGMAELLTRFIIPQVENKRVMVRLWVHEVFRVFYDRLTDDGDRAWLFNLMKGLIKEEFKENFDTVFEHLTEESKVTEVDLRSLMFGQST